MSEYEAKGLCTSVSDAPSLMMSLEGLRGGVVTARRRARVCGRGWVTSDETESHEALGEFMCHRGPAFAPFIPEGRVTRACDNPLGRRAIAILATKGGGELYRDLSPIDAFSIDLQE